MNDEQPPAGLVAGKYKLTRLLGRGGMGSVWEGVHATLGSRVACKFIEPEFVGSVDAVSRFENEARAAASLKSKHVVDVYDHGMMPDGRPYIVMEFLEGEPLDARLAKLGTLNAQQTATIVLQVSRALFRAHRNGIVHRDLKPENIFLVWDDEDQADVAKVVDFGIAKFTDVEASGISSATKTGSILGTPYYMSPEQARGLKNLDARSDNWSLGVIAYEAMTGMRPFDGEAVGDLLVKICTMDPTPPSLIQPSLPPSVDEWMKKALNRDPASRFQDVREMAESLVTVAGMPGRSTLGSAVGGANEATSGGAPHRAAPVATHGQGSPKATSGALTYAAVGVDSPAPPIKKTSPVVYLGAAIALIAAVGAAVSLGGRDNSVAETDGVIEEGGPSAASDSSAPSDLSAPTDRAIAPEPPTPAPVIKEEPAPEPEVLEPEAQKTPSAPVPRPRPVARPAPAPRTSPRPVPRAAPASDPAPAPAPRPAPPPAPRPPSGFDLGY